jgi:hypothetical protein
MWINGTPVLLDKMIPLTPTLSHRERELMGATIR